MTDVSLLDTAGCKVREWYILYFPRYPIFWFTKYLKQGFRHVEIVRPEYFGPGVSDCVWLQVLPTFEMLDVEICTDPRPPWVRCPGATVQKVTAIRPYMTVATWFTAGPVTCVDIIKQALGMRAFFVRTPYQLYKYIQRRNGVIDARK